MKQQPVAKNCTHSTKNYSPFLTSCWCPEELSGRPAPQQNSDSRPRPGVLPETAGGPEGEDKELTLWLLTIWSYKKTLTFPRKTRAICSSLFEPNRHCIMKTSVFSPWISRHVGISLTYLSTSLRRNAAGLVIYMITSITCAPPSNENATEQKCWGFFLRVSDTTRRWAAWDSLKERLPLVTFWNENIFFPHWIFKHRILSKWIGEGIPGQLWAGGKKASFTRRRLRGLALA